MLYRRDYNHVVICSGQDLLVKEGLDDYLSEYKDRVFLDLKLANGRWDRMIHMKKIPRLFMNSFENKFYPLRICRSLYFRMLYSKWGRLSENPDVG